MKQDEFHELFEPVAVPFADSDMPLINAPSAQSLYIEMLSATMETLASGTGFIIKRENDFFLVSNYHNLAGRHPETQQPMHDSGAVPEYVRIFHHRADGLGNWAEVVEPILNGSGEKQWLEHPVHGAKVDVAVLPLTKHIEDIILRPYAYVRGELTGHGAHELPTLPRLSAGVEVAVVGFPYGLTAGGYLPVWIRGIVATEPSLDWKELPRFLIDARTRVGNSGSPVVLWHAGGFTQLEDGRSFMIPNSFSWLLGVYSGRISKDSDLGLVWKTSVIEEILSTRDSTRPKP